MNVALGGSSLETRAGRLDSLLNVLSGRMNEGELVTLRAKLQCMTGFPKHDKRFLVYLLFNFCPLKFLKELSSGITHGSAAAHLNGAELI